MSAALSQAGRRKGRSGMVLYGIMFMIAYLPVSSRTMPSSSSGRVVDAVDQRPLILDRVAGAAGVGFAEFDELVGAMRGALGSSSARRSARLVWSDSASAGLTARVGRRSKTRWSPTVENTRFLWPMPPSPPRSWIASIDVVEVVGRLAHAHEYHFLHGTLAPADHLGDDLGAAHLTQQAVAPVMQNTQPTAQPT